MCESVGEYTGLKDKNSREIYDGDLLDGGHLYIVEWDKENAMYVLRVVGFHYGEPMYEYNISNMSIVGNIYENPELLEVKGNE